MPAHSSIIGPVIFLDHNATTPVRHEVFEAMTPFFTDRWGNPSSLYRFGAGLKGVIEGARDQVAELLGARPSEIVFTGNATEANNTAIHAALRADPDKRHIITSQVEHSSVLNHCLALERDGYRVTYLPVDGDGMLKLADLEGALTEDTAVVSLMWANNETGSRQLRRSTGAHWRTYVGPIAAESDYDITSIRSSVLASADATCPIAARTRETDRATGSAAGVGFTPTG